MLLTDVWWQGGEDVGGQWTTIILSLEHSKFLLEQVLLTVVLS